MQKISAYKFTNKYFYAVHAYLSTTLADLSFIMNGESYILVVTVWVHKLLVIKALIFGELIRTSLRFVLLLRAQIFNIFKFWFGNHYVLLEQVENSYSS